MSKMAHFTQKCMLCLFLTTSVLFIFSWFFLLRSSSRHSLDFSILPNSMVLSMGGGNEDLGGTSLSGKCGGGSRQILKVFMYDLPSVFHFDLLNWKNKVGNSVWPDVRVEVPEYPGGLNLQHSIEYWLTLDLLSSQYADDLKGRSAVRVHNSSEADVVFVPFFSSISYNRFTKKMLKGNKSINVELQEKLVGFLKAQQEWKRSGGRDHIILAHHPNSLLDARMKLWPAVYILSDFGRYPSTVANVEKDVIAPYKHVIKSYKDDTSDFDSRQTLLYFQGAIYRKDVSYRCNLEYTPVKLANLILNLLVCSSICAHDGFERSCF